MINMNGNTITLSDDAVLHIGSDASSNIFNTTEDEEDQLAASGNYKILTEQSLTLDANQHVVGDTVSLEIDGGSSAATLTIPSSMSGNVFGDITLGTDDILDYTASNELVLSGNLVLGADASITDANVYRLAFVGGEQQIFTTNDTISFITVSVNNVNHRC
jgi:hypothetical protein